MENKKQFSFYTRKRKKGKPVYYVRFRQPDGSWGSGKNTGQTSDGAAEGWAVQYLKQGQILDYENITMEQFSKDFFDWSGSWATDLKARGKKISERQCKEKASILKKHIIPTNGKKRLTEINKSTIKNFRNQLYSQGKSGSTINKILSCIKVILEAAEEQRLIQVVPKFEWAALKCKIRGILTPQEAKAVLSVDWSDKRAYAANLTAAVTGLRQGEILALTRQSIRDGYLDILCSWNQSMNKLNETTKTGKIRYVPIPQKVEQVLRELLTISPWQSANSFIFFSTKLERKPMDGKVAIRGLFKAMEKIGINKAARIERFIDFHSWRDWLNSVLINSGVPGVKVKKTTGHDTDKMLEHYYRLDDMEDIRQIQEKLFVE